MIDRVKVLNFLQDFGCAKLEHLQILFNDSENNFKTVLYDNMVSKKENVFVHNTKRLDNRMLTALDILCKFKKRFTSYWVGHSPVNIEFITKENIKYHIIVVDEENREGILRLINSSPLPFSINDRLILAFPTGGEVDNIKCEIPFLYCVYPELEIINTIEEEIEDEDSE